MGIILAIIIFSFIVFFHELGHFLLSLMELIIHTDLPEQIDSPATDPDDGIPCLHPGLGRRIPLLHITYHRPVINRGRGG